jgi:hypothetical protein
LDKTKRSQSKIRLTEDQVAKIVKDLSIDVHRIVYTHLDNVSKTYGDEYLNVASALEIMLNSLFSVAAGCVADCIQQSPDVGEKGWGRHAHVIQKLSDSSVEAYQEIVKHTTKKAGSL